jgi:hypothetical protein
VIQRTAGEALAVVYAALDVAVIMAPALVVVRSGLSSGLTDGHGIDLVAASAVIAGLHAVVAWSRLRTETAAAARRGDVWIAAVDSLVVLALSTTLLMIVVLEGFAGEHAVLIQRGWPLLGLWSGVLLLAIAMAEATGRLLFRWLERAPLPGGVPASPPVHVR